MAVTRGRRLRRWAAVAIVAGAAVGVLAVASLPCVPLVHGTTEDEVERLVTWLEIKAGSLVADLGAGDGTYAIAENWLRRLGSTPQSRSR